MSEQHKFYWLRINAYDQNNLRVGDEAVSFCIGPSGIKALYEHMCYPFYEEDWPATEPILDDKALKLKCAESHADMEKRSDCFTKKTCANDCELVHCTMREVLKSKTMTPQEFVEKTLRGIQRSSVSLVDALDILKSGHEEVEGNR